MSKITFQQATQGYLLAAGARHLSEHTIRDYVNAFTKLTAFGHSSLDMVKNYLRIAQIDIDTAHRRASPVDNWRL